MFYVSSAVKIFLMMKLDSPTSMAQGKLSPLGYLFILLHCNILTSSLELFARNFYVVPVVAPDLQLVTKEVSKNHVQVMSERCKALLKALYLRN